MLIAWKLDLVGVLGTKNLTAVTFGYFREEAFACCLNITPNTAAPEQGAVVGSAWDLAPQDLHPPRPEKGKETLCHGGEASPRYPTGLSVETDVDIIPTLLEKWPWAIYFVALLLGSNTLRDSL